MPYPWRSFTRSALVALALLTTPMPGLPQVPVPDAAKLVQELLPMMRIPRTGEQVPVPRTDTEVLRLLDYGDPGLTETLRGLYQTYRAQGLAVLEAFAKTLQAYGAAYKSQEHTGHPR